MKKALLAAAVIGFVMTSCKKDYTCNCVDSDGEVIATYTAEMKKKDAESWCTSWNSSVSLVDGKCTLK